MKILLIDDDEKLLNLLEEYLKDRDIEVFKATSGEEGLSLIEKETFDLAILDVMMPVMDGLEVLRRVNNRFNYLPVIMLTARGDEADRIVGLELGADDYIVKPFSPRELLARIKALMRTQKRFLRQAEKNDEPVEEELYLDLQKREVTHEGKIIELTSVEFEILSILHQNKGIVLSREKIMDLARGKEFIAFDRSIDVHISHLRQKLEKDPKNPELIKTIWGVGYLFTGG